jgi:hypothetical protein
MMVPVLPALIGSYRPPALNKGEWVWCLYRDADCKVTGAGMESYPLAIRI